MKYLFLLLAGCCQSGASATYGSGFTRFETKDAICYENTRAISCIPHPPPLKLLYQREK